MERFGGSKRIAKWFAVAAVAKKQATWPGRIGIGDEPPSFSRLADEDLRFGIVRAVRRMAPGIEFTTIVEQGISSADDEVVLELAWQQRWLLVSHDVNSMKACAEERIRKSQGVHGVFLVPQHRTIPMVAECLILISEASEFEEWNDRVVICLFESFGTALESVQ